MLLSAFLLGLGGSFHCIAMCGPIALVLPVNRNNKWKALWESLVYHTGRLTTYSVFGFLFGLLGKGLYISGFQQRVSILMGILMILAVVLPMRYINKIRPNRFLYRLVEKLKIRLGEHLQKKSKSALFIIGLLNGILPCGLVYIALFAAVAMSGTYMGAWYMFVFGLGTIPLLTGIILLGNFLSLSAKNFINKIIPYFVVLVGILFIIRGLGLGIPFISPPDTRLQIDNNAKKCSNIPQEKTGTKYLR